MSGDIAPVVRLGQDLVRNFEALPAEKAAEEIATHITKFWEPRMRRDLVERVRAGEPDIPPVLAEAAADLLGGDVDREEVTEASGG